MSRHILNRFFAAFFLSGVFSCGLAGCSIHPLPADVTGYSTATIVRKIRCEAHDAIMKSMAEILHKKYRHQDIDENNVLDMLDKGIDANSWEMKKLQELADIGILYDFNLSGDEKNNLMLSGDIIKPFKNGSESFSPAAGNMTERNNVRAFTVSDNFTTLVNLTNKKRGGDERHCDFNGSPSGPNFEYPIAGRIGLDEMVQTFVRLAVAGDFVDASVGSDGTPTLNASGAPTLVDTLTFTTTVSGGLTPSVSLMPGGTALQVMNLELAGTVTRMDVHKVIIAMAVGKSTSKLSIADAQQLLTPKTTALLFTPLRKTPHTGGQELAAQAATQYIIRNHLHGVSIVAN